jgi:hypothetical protein
MLRHATVRTFVTGVAIAIAAAGCSLLVSTSGLSGAAEASDAGVADARAGESGPPLDSGIDADAAPGPYCASLVPKPKFCADFDDGAIAEYGQSNGAVSLDTLQSKSAPASLLATVEANATERYGQLVRSFQNDTPSSVDLSFDAYVDEYDATHDVELMTVRFVRPAQKVCLINVAIRRNAWTFDETCDDGSTAPLALAHASSILLKQSRWTHVEVSASFVAPRTFSLSVDGVMTFSGVPLAPALTTGAVQLIMGITYLQAQSTRAKVHTDNVRLDYR